MAVRPKVRTSNGMSDYQTEELSCGYIMHQYKGVRSKMRWGQLWTGVNQDGVGRCSIRLFKYDMVNPKPGTFTKKDLKEKLYFDFTEEDFCGLEKGEHYTRYGMRRYICIILKSKHLIVQDAITAMTDTDHDVIGTWYKKISETMRYINRWKIFKDKPGNTDVKFLHVSKENMCECFSLHNSSVGQKGKILLDNLWKTKDISNIDEDEVMHDGDSCARVSFYDQRMEVKISMILHGEAKLSSIVAGLSRNPSRPNKGTVCAKFDDLKLNPNLVRMPPLSKVEKKNTPPMNLRQLSYKNKIRTVNQYVMNEQDDDLLNHNGDNIPKNDLVVNIPSTSQPSPQHGTISPMSPSQPAVDAYQIRHNGSENRNPPNMFSSRNGLPPRHHTSRSHSPPPRPPRDPLDDHDLHKKAPDLATQTSFDSGYQTNEHWAYDGSTTSSREDILDRQSTTTSNREANYQLENQNGPYMNVLNIVTNPAQVPHYPDSRPAVQNHSLNSVSLNPPQCLGENSSSIQVPPAIPERDEIQPDMVSRDGQDDLIERAIRLQHLTPIDTNPETFRPAYENSLTIEVTIGEILNGDHREIQAANLGLPYSVYMALVLGLEKDSISQGNWRGLASALHMSFRDVEQIESAVHNHPMLLPAQILLLQWHRTQAPYPYTRFHLRSILSDMMARFDLAALIQCEEDTVEKSVEDKKE